MKEGEVGSNTRWDIVAAYVTIFSVIYYVVAVALLHFLRTDYDPGYRFLSEYVIGPYGELMRSTFFVFGVGALALSFGLWRSVSAKLRFLPGLLLWVIWAGAVFLAGIYTADLQGSPPTESGKMHALMSMIGFPCVVLAMPLISVLLRWEQKWRSVWLVCVALSAALIICFFAIGQLAEMRLAGLGQRVFLACMLAWMFVLGWKLLKIEKQGEA
jgi:hypothetical protein